MNSNFSHVPRQPAVAKGSTVCEFAAWSETSDAVLLMEGVGVERGVVRPVRFLAKRIQLAPSGKLETTEVATYSSGTDWTEAVRALKALRFPIREEPPWYDPVPDPFWGVPKGEDLDGVQTVSLRSRTGRIAVYRRTSSRPSSRGKPALGFPSPDGRLLYITPDEEVILLQPAPGAEPQLDVKLSAQWGSRGSPGPSGPITYEREGSGALVQASFAQFQDAGGPRSVEDLVRDATNFGRDAMHAGEPVRTDSGKCAFGEFGAALFSPNPPLPTVPPIATVQVWFLMNGRGGLLLFTFMSGDGLDSVDRTEAETIVMSANIAWRSPTGNREKTKPWWKFW